MHAAARVNTQYIAASDPLNPSTSAKRYSAKYRACLQFDDSRRMTCQQNLSCTGEQALMKTNNLIYVKPEANF